MQTHATKQNYDGDDNDGMLNVCACVNERDTYDKINENGNTHFFPSSIQRTLKLVWKNATFLWCCTRNKRCSLFFVFFFLLRHREEDLEEKNSFWLLFIFDYFWHFLRRRSTHIKILWLLEFWEISTVKMELLKCFFFFPKDQD